MVRRGFGTGGIDFLSTKKMRSGAKSIICNPPFELFEEFALHALKLGPAKVAMIALGGPLAIMAAKKMVREVPDLPRDAAFAVMATLSGGLFTSAEGQEGMAAFREKRKPNWVQGAKT